MAHGDDDGLILPPRLAPYQVVIVPVYKGEDQKAHINEQIGIISGALKQAGIRVRYDDSDHNRPGWKFAEYELKGVPVRLTLGARDLANRAVEVFRRDTREKMIQPLEGLEQFLLQLLEQIQKDLFTRSKTYLEEHITVADDLDTMIQLLDGKAGFVSAHWDGTAASEEKIKDLTKATIRCIPLQTQTESGKCILTGQPSSQRVLFARAY
jgi:prolyl-tRNA synthetase